MAATIQVSHLVADVGTAVNDARANARAVGKLPGLVVDLKRKNKTNLRTEMRFLIIPKSRFVALSQLVKIFKSYEITNLSCQFSSRGKHKCQRALLPTSVGLASSALLRSILVNMVQDWNQEGGCFATASLGTGHQISLAQYDRKGVFLRNKNKRT